MVKQATAVNLWQYTQHGLWATNFLYMDVRSLTEAQPLSFS